MGDTYPGSFSCYNCGWDGTDNVPKGTTLIDHALKSKCPVCGCATISRNA